jgi:hypothetical protein
MQEANMYIHMLPHSHFDGAQQMLGWLVKDGKLSWVTGCNWQHATLGSIY